MSHDAAKGAGRRIKAFLAAVIVIALSFVFATFLRSQLEALADVERAITRAERELAEEMNRTDSLKAERASQDSDEFKERIARDVFKLVYPHEIVFKKR